jgi:nicotinamide-nucleotide amidase
MQNLSELSTQLGLLLQQGDQVLVTAESCTGGGVATAITDIAGSSTWFDRAFITYSNDAKMEMLGVRSKTLGQFGAVSEAVVVEMALGALRYSNGTLSVAISGIAGPGGGSEDKPVGTVCFAWASSLGWQKVETCLFAGDRAAVRSQAVWHALTTLLEHVTDEEPFS